MKRLELKGRFSSALKIFHLYFDDYRLLLTNEKCTRKEEFKKGIALNENIIEAIPSAMILDIIWAQAGNHRYPTNLCFPAFCFISL